MIPAHGRRTSAILRAYYTGADHPMKLRLWGWLRRAASFRGLTLPYCERALIALDERDLVQRQVLIEGFYEPEVWEALFAFATGGEVVWDLGAHVGTFTIRCLFDARVKAVHAFEPDPLTAEKLERNVRLNISREAACHVHKHAIGSSAAVGTLYRGPIQNTGLSSLVYQPTAEAFRIDCRSIDDLVFTNECPPPTLMKIDVEGSEGDLLEGAERVLREHSPKALVIEAAADSRGRLVDQTVSRHLRAANYSIVWIQRPGGYVEARENYLAVSA